MTAPESVACHQSRESKQAVVGYQNRFRTDRNHGFSLPMNSNESEHPAPGKQNIKSKSPDINNETMAIEGDTSAGVRGAARSPEAWVGRQLGRFKVTGVLGIGGMGVVLKAHDPSIERDIAIKVLPTELSTNEVALGRFLSEAKSAGKLNHPNTVTIYEISQEDSTHFLVMEIVAGGSAEDHLEKQGSYSVAAATRMIIEACNGLTAAHRAGLIHRDIKPSNLLLTEDGSVKISDFGLAKRAEGETLQMTQAGQIIGTPYFMSPEQCESQKVDARSDVYSLGATYYSLLTGKNPFYDSNSVVQVMYAHCNSDPPDPRAIRADVPAACSHIIERAMSKNPEDRYASMGEMRVDLEAVLAAISGTGIELPSKSATPVPGTTSTQPAPAVAPATSTPESSANRPNNLFLGAGLLGIIAMVAVAAFLIFGNGLQNENTPGGNLASTPTDPSASPPLPAPAGDPIRIGVLHSLTGTMSSSESPVVDAVLLAVNELNQSGGVLGRPVEAVVADGRSDSKIFAQEAERLIQQDQVCTVFGCWTSASRKTVVPVFEELDHLLMYPVQYEGIEESPNVIYLGAAPNQQIIPAIKWAYAFQNKRQFFLVGSDYVFPRIAHEIIKDQLKELGAELTGEAFIPLGSPDVKTTVQQIQELKPDVILNSINGDTNIAFFAELRNAGITPENIPTISFSIGEAELQHLNVSAMAGDYAAWNYFQSVPSDENQDFVTAFRSRYGPQRVVTDPMEAAYSGVKLWAKAVADAGTTDTSDIRRSLRNQRMHAPGGDIRIDPATQHTFKTPRIGQVGEDGQFEIIWTASQPQQPIPYPVTRTTEQWRAFLHDLYTGWNNAWAAPTGP